MSIVDILEFDAELFADELAAGEDGDVFEDRFASDRQSQEL